MKEGRAKESMCKRMLSSVPEEGMDIIEQAYAASAPFAAGVETVSPPVHRRLTFRISFSFCTGDFHDERFHMLVLSLKTSEVEKLTPQNHESGYAALPKLRVKRAGRIGISGRTGTVTDLR